MSCGKKLALAGDVLFYLKRAGVDMDYAESLELAGNLLDDGDWVIEFRGGPEPSTKQDALALRADELAQKVVDAVTVYLEAKP